MRPKLFGAFLRSQNFANLLNAAQLSIVMDDGVTVGAYWTQVSVRINQVFDSDLGKRPEVMDMYEARKLDAIYGTEVESANYTRCALFLFAPQNRLPVPFVGIDQNSPGRTLFVMGCLADFLWQRRESCAQFFNNSLCL